MAKEWEMFVWNRNVWEWCQDWDTALVGNLNHISHRDPIISARKHRYSGLRWVTILYWYQDYLPKHRALGG